MKQQICLFAIFGILAAPTFAANMCREEAKAVGYEAALELLEPCQPTLNLAMEQFHVERIARDQSKLNRQPDVRPVTQVYAAPPAR